MGKSKHNLDIFRGTDPWAGSWEEGPVAIPGSSSGLSPLLDTRATKDAPLRGASLHRVCGWRYDGGLAIVRWAFRPALQPQPAGHPSLQPQPAGHPDRGAQPAAQPIALKRKSDIGGEILLPILEITNIGIRFTRERPLPKRDPLGCLLPMHPWDAGVPFTPSSLPSNLPPPPRPTSLAPVLSLLFLLYRHHRFDVTQ